MVKKHQICFLFVALILLPIIVLSKDNDIEINNERANEKNAEFSDDEISYALRDLSVDELNALSNFVDTFAEEGNYDFEGDIKPELSEATRFKRENSDKSVLKNDEYIKQLDDSFPHVIEQQNQYSKEKELIRVKRE